MSLTLCGRAALNPSSQRWEEIGVEACLLLGYLALPSSTETEKRHVQAAEIVMVCSGCHRSQVIAESEKTHDRKRDTRLRGEILRLCAHRFFSIVGITGTALPVMYMLFGDMLVKFAKRLGLLFYASFRPLLMFLAKDVPKFLHGNGFLEAALYLA